MSQASPRCLILACGNTLRRDDGVGPWLASWAAERFRANQAVRIVSRQQWTPELAEEVSRADAVVFIDCSVDSPPGVMKLARVEPSRQTAAPSGHHLGAAELLALANDLYGSVPRTALLLTLGAGSVEIGEEFSDAAQAALPEACRRLEETLTGLLAESPG